MSVASARARASFWAFVSSFPSFFRRSFLSFSFCFFFSLRSCSRRSYKGSKTDATAIRDETTGKTKVKKNKKEVVELCVLPFPASPSPAPPASSAAPPPLSWLAPPPAKTVKSFSDIKHPSHHDLHDYVSHNAPPPSSWPGPPAWPSLWPC